MEQTKLSAEPGQPLSNEEVTSVAGGTGSCPTSVTVGTDGASMTDQGESPTDVLISIYEGFVDVTSHIIERVVAITK
jgi:hypothetical protein